MTPEAKVKKKVVATLKEFGAYFFYPVTGGYGRSGVPDVVACYNGFFVGIECKAGSNKPTPLQQKNLKDIAAAGGISLVINEDNLSQVGQTLQTLGNGKQQTWLSSKKKP
jgi:hypothetical protein